MQNVSAFLRVPRCLSFPLFAHAIGVYAGALGRGQIIDAPPATTIRNVLNISHITNFVCINLISVVSTLYLPLALKMSAPIHRGQKRTANFFCS